MVTDPMVSIFDNKFDSLNTSCGKVSDEISFSKSSDFWGLEKKSKKVKSRGIRVQIA
jgi:hypothetical protein